MISQPNAKQSPDEVDYQIQDLLLSYYKSYSDEQKAMAGFTIISQWPGSIKTFACVEAMLSCTMDAKNPASHCAREWLWKCPPGLVSAAKSLRHSFSEKTAESIRSSHLPGDHPIGNVTNPPDWPTLINHFNLRGFDYYPPINRPDLFAACEWLRGRFNKEDAQGITLMLSKLSRLAQMSKIRQKIGRTVLRGEAHYELLFNNIDLRSEWLNLLDYSPNTVEYNPDRKKENTQRFYLVRATLDHLPKMSKKEQQEIISRLVEVRHLWAYFYANRILGWAKKLFKPDHEFWQKLPDWLEGWANFEYDLMGSCHDLYFDCRKQPEEWSFCISHKPEKLQEIFGKLPAWISVAAIAKICQKGKENRDGYDPGNLLRPKFGEVEEFTKQINRDPAAARKHFEAALQYLTVSYAMAVSYGKVTKDDAALAKWWHPRRLVVTREACEQVAKSMVKNNLINPEIIQIRYVEGLVKSGYKLKPADINDEVVLYKLLARRYDYGFVPWFDETFGQWEEVILASAKLPLLIIDSIAENLPEVENRVVENGYELFYLKMDRLAGNRIFFEAMSELAWVPLSPNFKQQIGNDMSLKSPELLRRYLTGKLNNPSGLTGKSREQARVYYKNHLKRCDLREIDQAKLFLSREEMLQSLFSSKFISKDNCLPAAEHLMLDGETERKRLKGWLLALPDEHHIIASWLEWVKYFNFAADSEFRQRLTAIAGRNYGRDPDSPSNIALSLLAKG